MLVHVGLQAVLRETSWYLAIMTILMFAYACAFYTVFKDDNKASFDSLPLSMLTMLVSPVHAIACMHVKAAAAMS